MEIQDTDEEVDDILSTLREDLHVMKKMKRENEKLRATNRKLRTVISDLIKEVRDLKEETDGDFAYDYAKGWKERTDMEVDQIEELPPEEVEQQLMKIRQILGGDDEDD